MKEKIFLEKNFKKWFIVLVFFSVLANIKSIFNDYDIDAGYAVTMAYRMVKGEKMFSDMWEPHQTSAFLCAFFIKIYVLLTGTVTGIVLYLNTVGVVIRGLIAIFFYKSMKQFIRKDMLMLMCLFFFSTAPKGLPIPEFSNMQVWAAVCLICCLVKYLNDQKKDYWLIWAAVFLCIEVLSYPSCIIVYAGVVWIILRYAQNKRKAFLVFTATCAGIGFLYCGRLVMELGIDRLLKGVGNMMASDGSHQHKTLIDKWWGYALESGEILLFLGGVSVFAYCVLRIWDLIMKRINTEKKWFSIPHWLFLTFAIIFAGEMWDILSQNMEYYSYRLPIYALIMLVAMFALKHCNLEEQQIVVAGMVISGLSFIATLMLTNLTVMASLNYMIPAVMVMFIPIIRGIEKIITENRWRKYYSLLFIFCALVIFRNGYLIRSMHCMQSGPFSIVPNYVKSGPAVGVISEWLGPAMFDSALSEWEQYVDEGNSVLMVGTYAFDPLQYLFEDVEISMYSTICTPTYSKKLLEYWTDYPEKYPEVVIVSCWYGDLQIAEDSWIMQWLAQEHPACEYVDGKYWRYYFLQ